MAGPDGVGAAMVPPTSFLRPGDVMRVEVEGIGSLTTRVAPAPAAAGGAAGARSALALCRRRCSRNIVAADSK